jgi:hypothetical protein
MFAFDDKVSSMSILVGCMARSFVLFLACIVLSGCSSIPLIGSLSPQAAEREAHRDIASDHMKLYRAGTIASTEVGIKPQDRALVSKLPRDDRLSSGCTDPDASAHIAYARAYNKAIIRYLREHPQT